MAAVALDETNGTPVAWLGAEMGTQGSMDWVRRAGDYRVLVGKRDRLGYPLGAEEQARLEELERFFVQDANRRRVPWATREQIRAPIAIVVQLGDIRASARDISGDGIFIETETPLPIGARTVVCITDDPMRDDDEAEGPYEEWRFGAEVVRLERGGMGLRFVGIPLVLRITHRGRDEANETSSYRPYLGPTAAPSAA